MIGLVQLHFGGSLPLLEFENFGLWRILTKLIWWLEVTIVKGRLNGAGCYSGQRGEGQASNICWSSHWNYTKARCVCLTYQMLSWQQCSEENISNISNLKTRESQDKTSLARWNHLFFSRLCPIYLFISCWLAAISIICWNNHWWISNRLHLLKQSTVGFPTV